MHIKLFRLLVVLVTLPVFAVAQETEPRLVSEYTDWMLYTFTGDQGQVCYIASAPTKEEGNYTRRGRAAVFVARFPFTAERGSEEVSIQPGYSYLKDSKVEVAIDRETFELFTDGQHAWLYSSEEDGKLIAAMRRGAEMTVRGTSIKETYSLDTYSLRGFTAAINAMKETCSG